MSTNLARDPIGLRLRVDAALTIVFIAAVVAFTIGSAWMSRAEALRGERLHATALLDHLAAMSLESDDDLNREIAALSAYLEAAGAELSIVAAGTPLPRARFAVERTLPSSRKPRVLRYIVSSERIAGLTRSIVTMHAATGLLALGLMLGAVEWTLRRRLLRPLALFREQLDASTAGRWTASLPQVDIELNDLRDAIGKVGPAVHAQTVGWLEERHKRERAAAAARVRNIMEERLPAIIARIEHVTRGTHLSVLSLNEAYAAEEEVVAMWGALTELQALMDSPADAKEGHA